MTKAQSQAVDQIEQKLSEVIDPVDDFLHARARRVGRTQRADGRTATPVRKRGISSTSGSGCKPSFIRRETA